MAAVDECKLHIQSDVTTEICRCWSAVIL